MANEAKFVLSLDGDASALSAIFAAFKREAKSAVTEVQQTTNNLRLFQTLDADLKKAAASVDTTRASLASLTRTVDALRAAGEPVGKDLAQSLTQAQRAAAAAEKDFVKQSQAVDKLRTTLKASNVDLSNMAAAELKLAEAARQATAAQVEQQNKTATGFRTLKDIQPEINKIVAAYQALASSGKLSFGELSILQTRAQQQINALQATVGGLGQAFREVRGAVIGFAAAFAGVVAAGANSAASYRDFTTQIAAVGTIADVSEAKLAELTEGVRSLARTMGVDAVDSAKALYDIIGSGISADNSLQVLATASQAARAGLTDVHTAAQVGVAILNGYGLQVDQLEGVYDILFQTVKDGVVSFPELAKNIGSVIPIARAASVPLKELGAAFVVLTRQGIDAPEAATAIARAIQDLAAPAPAAADAMRELGIQFKGLFGTIEQFASKNLSLDQIQRLIPDARAAKAVLALAQNFALLRQEVTSLGNASNSMRLAYERMAETPQAKVDRFNAAIKDLSLSIGQFVTNGTGFVETLTKMVNGFNGLGEKTRTAAIQFAALTVAVVAATVAWRTFGPLVNLVVGSLASASTTLVTLTSGLTAATVAAGAFKVVLAGYAGFRLGELLYEWSAAARILGDVLGTVLASFDALAKFIGGTWGAILTLNKQRLLETWDAFKRNASVIAGDFVNAVTGAAERARAFAGSQAALGDELNKTAKAAGDAAGVVDKAVTGIVSKLDAQAKAIETALSSAQARLTALTASLAKGVQDLTSGAQQALSNLAATTSQRLAGLSSFDVQKVLDTVKVQKDAATQRLAIIQQFAADATRAFDTEANARRAIAVKSGEDLKRVDQEIAQGRIDVLQKVVDAYRAHVAELLTLERQHLDNVRQIENERRGINQDVEEKIREIRRAGLTEYEQYQDKIRQIDQLTSQARQALANGDNKLAEELSKKVISLAGSVTTAVKDGEREVVSASSAQSTAISKITAAQDLLNKSLGERAAVEKQGAEAAAAGLREAIPLLEEYKAKLAEVTAQAKEGIQLRIQADAAEVEKAVAEVQRLLSDQFVTLHLQAELKDANEDLKKAKDLLAAGIPVDIKPQTQAVQEAIENIRNAKPELNVDTGDALAKVTTLRDRITDLDNLKTKSDHTVNSNVDQVQAQIDNLKKDTSSTHTVNVVVNNPNGAPVPTEPAPGFARGGIVGAVRRFASGVQHFARGGSVFGGAGKVPGQGSGDTVPALLQAGQFVVRKAASSYYGGGLMGMLARGFASGGEVKKEDLQKWANSGGTSDPPVNFDSRDIPEAFVTASNVIQYAREMLNAVGANNPLLGSLKPAIEQGITAVERNPGDKAALAALLQAAETIGSNFSIFNMWGKTQSGAGGADLTPIWFIDWLTKRGYNVAGAGGSSFGLPGLTDFAKQFFKFAAAKAGPATNILFGGGSHGVMRRFAEGGSTDTVPAMLTPGEFVMQKSAVARFGSGLMHAINNMTLPRDMLANMLAPPVSRFAMGGPVGAVSAPASFGPSGNGPTIINNTFNLDGGDLLSEQQVRKKVVPVLDEIMKRKGRNP